jgi:flagellar assembly protein FliH
MILRSDSTQKMNVSNDWPPDFVSAAAQEVSRLEFQFLNRSEALTQIEPRAASSRSDSFLEEEILSLREKLQVEIDQRSLELEASRSVERSEARREWEEELAERIRTEREAILERLTEFRQERDRYFLAVEGEVVKLSLAIARRILHREANVDPFLLSGVVRVALEKVSGDSTVVLRVSTGDLENWERMNAMAKGARPQLIADERLEAGECVLDTSIGSVELGVAAQLQEIERGFFDLLQQRPA